MVRARNRAFEILEVAAPGDRTSRAFDVLILSLIALNVLAIVLESVQPIYERAPNFFRWFETLSVIVFSAEYALRVWSCVSSARFSSPIAGRIRFAFTPLAIVDLMAVLPFYLPLAGFDLRFVRAVRLFRVFRIAKVGRYSDALQAFGRVLRSKREELVMTLVVLLVLLLLASSLMYYAEHDAQPDVFTSIPAAMWWGVATITTVGYGDIYPITALGKLLGSTIAVLGIAMFALPTGILGAGFVEELQWRKASSAVCPHCNKPLRQEE